MPERIMTLMGCILYFLFPIFIGKYTRQKATTHIVMLIISSRESKLGQKLAEFISMIAAEAIKPTTTGLRPEKIPFITPLSLWRRMKCAQYSTNIKLGTITANVAATDPNTPQNGEANSGFISPGAT